jgi:Outer membrane protein beta-barrel domain
MKKLIIIFSFVFVVLPGKSQVLISILFGDKLNSDKIEFGLDGGLTLSDITGLDQSKVLSGFNLGFYFDFKMKNPNWMLNTGVLIKSPMGARGLPVYSLNNPDLDNAFTGGSVTTNLRYFNVPVTMKYQFKNKFFAKAGIQLGVMNKAFDEFSNTIASNNDLKFERKTKNLYHPLDAGLAFGIGYRLMKGKGMNLGIQYYLGLVDVKMDDSTPDQMNRAWYFNVGIPIGKAAAKNKAE